MKSFGRNPWTALGRHRRLRTIVVSLAAGLAVVGLVLAVVYPALGGWMIRSRLVPRLEAKLGRQVEIGDVSVGLGHAVLRDLSIRGERDGGTALVTVDRVDVDFDFASSLVGGKKVERAQLTGVAASLRRGAGGDNFADLIERFGGGAGGEGRAGSGGGLGIRPAVIEVSQIRVAAVDETTGVELHVADGHAVVRAGQERVELTGISVTTTEGPSAGIERLVVTKGPSGRALELLGGRATPWPGLDLTGVVGTIAALPETGEPRFAVDLKGGYGGVDKVLWTATGWIEPRARVASIALNAERFQLDQLRTLLTHTQLVRTERTSIDARGQLDVTADTARFAGGFHLRDLAIGHPLLASQDVPDIDVTGQVAVTFDKQHRTLVLERGDFVSRDLPVQLTGRVLLPGGLDDRGVPRATRAIAARFVIPPAPCQRVLDAIPRGLTPYMAGFQLKGKFGADVNLAIDWSDLPATRLDGHVGIFACTPVEAPDEIAARLLGPFEHFVEVEQDEWISFMVGPENPDFVPFTEISPYLVQSVITTEDGSFFRHRGFIPSEFRTALIKNLEAGYFTHGASSITMQLVKNVILYRDKTLARKLQELFLTWFIETALEKERILEIYFNVIEYGPRLYGIGPAARHFFGKAPRDLTLREAAFFSTVLPRPKDRYREYCDGSLKKWTADKIDRILARMLERNRITEQEYAEALVEPLTFVKDGSESVAECLERVKKAMKNARPTNPMKILEAEAGREADGKKKDRRAR